MFYRNFFILKCMIKYEITFEKALSSMKKATKKQSFYSRLHYCHFYMFIKNLSSILLLSTQWRLFGLGFSNWPISDPYSEVLCSEECQTKSF